MDTESKMKDHIYNRLLEERIVLLSGEVRDDMANMVCAQLLLLSSLDAKKDIFMYINSPGGSVQPFVALQQIAAEPFRNAVMCALSTQLTQFQ